MRFLSDILADILARHGVRGRVLLCTQKLEAESGLEELIRAFASSVGRRGDWSLVFAAGFSAGGGGTHAIGCYLGDRFRGIAALAGAGTFEACEGRVAVMQIQGTSDFVAREEAAAAIREAGMSVAREGQVLGL